MTAYVTHRVQPVPNALVCVLTSERFDLPGHTVPPGEYQAHMLVRTDGRSRRVAEVVSLQAIEPGGVEQIREWFAGTLGDSLRHVPDLERALRPDEDDEPPAWSGSVLL